MQELFLEISKNKILIVTLLGWIIAQTIKVIIGVVREKRFNFLWFIGTGGMPSSHASGASALATSIGMTHGFDSVYFALAAMFALVTMFDAQGVRRATGKQARILNMMMTDMHFKKKIQEERLRELIGHTPIEVFAGAILGALIAIVFFA
jgi:acid phosphatase family membrane protein YuiD